MLYPADFTLILNSLLAISVLFVSFQMSKNLELSRSPQMT